jgi:hypothetical protein
VAFPTVMAVPMRVRAPTLMTPGIAGGIEDRAGRKAAMSSTNV